MPFPLPSPSLRLLHKSGCLFLSDSSPMLQRSSHPRLCLPFRLSVFQKNLTRSHEVANARPNQRLSCQPTTDGSQITAFSFPPRPTFQFSAFSKAFTLIELLTVIAIIGILAGITFGVVRGVKERSNSSKAKAELAVLAQALESYKRQYGDYPWTGSKTQANAVVSSKIDKDHAQAQLLNALSGKIGPKLDLINGKSFIDLGKFKLETTDFPNPSDLSQTTMSDLVANSFLDPWGRRYRYYYKSTASPATWTNPSYVIFSVGPDGQTKASSDPTSAGEIDFNDSANLDNIYANRN